MSDEKPDRKISSLCNNKYLWPLCQIRVVEA